MKSALKTFYGCISINFLGVFVPAALFLMVGCTAPTKPVRMTTSKDQHPQVEKRRAADSDIEKRLRQEYRRWLGTQHRLGGSGRGGIDCSGFVSAVYKDVFNIELPRTTRSQVRQGRVIPFENLRAGDLVFFKPPSYPRHVGIYLGGSEFVHASKKNGVTVSKIDKVYWGKYYWTARRVLPSSRHP